MSKLEKPIHVRCLHQRKIVDGVLTDKGPTKSNFHPKLPNGKYRKKAHVKDNKWFYEVEGEDGPIEFCSEGD